MSELKFIKLIGEGDKEYKVSYEAAMVSPVLKTMLQSPFKENAGKVDLTKYSGDTLEKVCEYLEYKLRYQNADETEDIPEFDIPTELSVELLMVADYLNI
ncbi:elongin C NDAI_0E03050 [Naumovozyma dairenensis CBS 421]|uniref:Elongin-C n=1 Tax=Naumovozyma dairenensis (strain ATCC 10597 / BCRC 20456 / CBS 421 / NBRC 0211 / NRRL Y-12639) TaxID=1071378 RepID=G0WBK2_NAUDC|nr:hypothetical protein NDAI_0E03050 [Naumovozyma dairenensis CBS 421]CCD25122.1 hypothetical protein NDAI_0E03050 [Naumovozyma dairenensis CBS 421]